MTTFHFCVVATVLIVSLESLAAVVIPSDEGFVKSLDGQWRFKIEQASNMTEGRNDKGPRPVVVPKTFEPFEKLDYKEDDSWKAITVPGNWEMAGFSPATYYQPDN